MTPITRITPNICALPNADLGLRHALEALGEAGGPTQALRRAEAWRPWRAYALHHLWASLATSRRRERRERIA